MRQILPIFVCLFLLSAFGCTKEDEEISPCVSARVIKLQDECSGDILLEVRKENPSDQGSFFCGTPNLYRYVTVDNLPENLKVEGAKFTCKLKAVNSDAVCVAIYMMYEAAAVVDICSIESVPPVANNN